MNILSWRNRNENGGLSSARNKGIELAQGEFILPLDADDIIHPEYMEKAMENQIFIAFSIYRISFYFFILSTRIPVHLLLSFSIWDKGTLETTTFLSVEEACTSRSLPSA